MLFRAVSLDDEFILAPEICFLLNMIDVLYRCEIVELYPNIIRVQFWNAVAWKNVRNRLVQIYCQVRDHRSNKSALVANTI